MNKWIDYGFGDGNVGTIGYLVRTLDTGSGRESYALHDRPLRTNMSHEPRLFGWCGTTNNRSKTACGLVKIVALNGANDRAQIESVTGDEGKAFLERDGYPELSAEEQCANP